MLSGDVEKLYPSAKALVKDCVASRIHAKDASLYDFSEEARACSEQYMGWTDLASNSPYSLRDIQNFADSIIAQGLKTVVLIGQGGSTQAPMTITKYNKPDSSKITFKTLDSDSPVRVRAILAEAKPETTLFVISSKSGGTIEPRLALRAVRDAVADRISEEELVQHLVGIDLEEFMAHAIDAERQCSEDAIDNPAIGLASFLYDNYLQGRNKFTFLTQKRGRVLGLWIEQLVAESLGKDGQGILPNIEVDSLLLKKDPGDRSAIVYLTRNDLWDERRNFEMSLSYIDPAIPRANYKIDSVEELAEHFVMWEYAIAMCGYLMKICPFDQPDVASAKAVVLDILKEGQPEPDFVQDFIDEVHMGEVEVRLSPCFKDCTDVRSALRALLGSIQPGDFFALNAFLPFTGEGRREALETIRHGVAEKRGVVSCLEVGPRYLHSTGQLHKGGPNCGVFLILSADELKDIPLKQEAESLGSLAKAQASGDLVTLAERGRRVVHLHLPDNSGVTLRQLAEVISDILETMTVPTA